MYHEDVMVTSILGDCETLRENIWGKPNNNAAKLKTTPEWVDNFSHQKDKKLKGPRNMCPITVNFISKNTCKTTLNLHHAGSPLISRVISIESGIFQGDLLSQLLFFLATPSRKTTWVDEDGWLKSSGQN